jgi:hypothetical protein
MRRQTLRSSEFYAALWIGAWLVTGGTVAERVPHDLDELPAQFFARCRPAAKA